MRQRESVCICVYLSSLVFSKFLEYVVWCLLLILKTKIHPWLLICCLPCSHSLFSFWNSDCTYIRIQLLDALFCVRFFILFFFSFSFDFSPFVSRYVICIDLPLSSLIFFFPQLSWFYWRICQRHSSFIKSILHFHHLIFFYCSTPLQKLPMKACMLYTFSIRAIQIITILCSLPDTSVS